MIKKILSIVVILAMILAIPAFSLAASGADTVTSATPPKPANTTPPKPAKTAPPKTNKTTTPKANKATQTNTGLSEFSADIPYTLEEMLTYAIKDEFASQALYSKGMTSFGSEEPFARLLQEENGLIDQLTQVLADRGVMLPDLTAVPEQQAFATLREECLAAIRAEKISIEMYLAFLAKDNIPYDVRDEFQLLLTASQSNLDALNAKASQEGWIGSAEYHDDRDDADTYDDEDVTEDQAEVEDKDEAGDKDDEEDKDEVDEKEDKEDAEDKDDEHGDD
jgi:hypothetical protein